MKARIALFSVLLLILTAGGAVAETVAGLPLHVQKYETGAIRLWLGDHISSTAVMVFPTAEGLVIIDTTGNPKIDQELRRAIARELGRDDFAVLINTHEHGDHTGGNEVYADCRIVGHELVAEGMKGILADVPRMVEWMTENVPELEQQIAALAADDPERTKLEEQLILRRLNLARLQGELQVVAPTETFADRHVLDMGDTTFELYFIGGMHSASDIAVWVPQHGLLMTGDTMADVWLTDTPGCLASFAARTGVRHDFPRQLKNWNHLLTLRDQITTLVPGHWNGELTFPGFEARVKYVEALWEGIQGAVAAGHTLEQVLTEYALDTRFPELVDSPGCNGRNNYSTILEIWTETSGQQSAAAALYDLIDQGAPEADIRRVVAARDDSDSPYFFMETQINGWGYRFLQEQRPEAAAALFAVNVELYPESWNVYDSLGEALLACGNVTEAIAMYEKSLQINPENANGKDVLERIRAEAQVN